MLKITQFIATAAFVFLTQTSFAEEDPHLYGCYFYQSREPGEWLTSTGALFIEKEPKGILVHGSISSWHNSWISTPDNQSPVLLKRSANGFIYQGELNSAKPTGRCELTLHYDKENIYIKKHDQSCAEEWNTGDGIGPSEVKRTYKQPTTDMCLSYLGIVIRDEKEKKKTAN